MRLAKALAERVDQRAERVDSEPRMLEARRRVGQIDRGELEQPVAVVRHDHVGWGIGELAPKRLDVVGLFCCVTRCASARRPPCASARRPPCASARRPRMHVFSGGATLVVDTMLP